MGMYKKNKVNKVFARLTDEQVEYVDKMADAWNRNRSEVIRIIIDSYRAGGNNNANKQTDIND